MPTPPLRAVAEAAGHPLSSAELEAVAALLADMQADLTALRELALPEELEPILTFRVEPWT